MSRYEMFIGVDFDAVDADQLELMIYGRPLASGVDLADSAMVEYENADGSITAHYLLVRAIIALHVQRELNEFPAWTNIREIPTGIQPGAIVEFEDAASAMIFKLRKPQ